MIAKAYTAHGRAGPQRPQESAIKDSFTIAGRESEMKTLVFLALAHLADVVLRVELDAELGHEIELRLEEVDVVLLVGHQLFEQIAADIVLDRVTVGRGLGVKLARRHLGGEIAVE